jgi:hypothetical protein
MSWNDHFEDYQYEKLRKTCEDPLFCLSEFQLKFWTLGVTAQNSLHDLLCLNEGRNKCACAQAAFLVAEADKNFGNY